MLCCLCVHRDAGEHAEPGLCAERAGVGCALTATACTHWGLVYMANLQSGLTCLDAVANRSHSACLFACNDCGCAGLTAEERRRGMVRWLKVAMFDGDDDPLRSVSHQ